MTKQEEKEQSQLTAKKNYEAIGKTLPPYLKDQEEQLVNRFVKHNGNVFSKLQLLYGFMDELLECINRFTPCKKGCAHCCHFDISISELEAEYIRKYEGIKPAKGKGMIAPEDVFGRPCPFLKKGVCSIYKSRPFVCRRHVTLDDSPRWCRIEVCNDISLSQPRFSEVDRAYDMLLRESGLDRRNDIKKIFGVRS